LSCTEYTGTSTTKEKIKLAGLSAEKIPLESFFNRGIADDDCGKLVNLALCVPGIDVLAVGPLACLKVLYFRARKQGRNEGLFLLAVSSIDFIVGRHLEKLEKALEGLAASRRPRAIILYITCSDILAGSDIAGIAGWMESKYGIPVKVLERGPLSRRRVLPRVRLCDIFVNLLETGVRQGKKRHINLLGDAGKLPEESGLKRILTGYCRQEIREFAALGSYEAFEGMVDGKLNIALDRFGYDMAVRMREKWDIPFVFLPAGYNVEEIRGNYIALMEALHVKWDFSRNLQEYHRVAAEVSAELVGKKIAVGIGQRSFELAHTLARVGLDVAAVFAEAVDQRDMAYINALVAMGSQAEVCLVSNVAGETQAGGFKEIDIAIGEKALFYCIKAKAIPLSADYRFGYEGIVEILEAMR